LTGAAESAALALATVDVDPSPAVGALAALAVKPLALDADVRRVLLSPDGALGLVPFTMLLPGVEIAYVPARALRGSPRRRTRRRPSGTVSSSRGTRRRRDSPPKSRRVLGGTRSTSHATG
jgi:hypothetical protein